jgi:hypothetical protein
LAPVPVAIILTGPGEIEPVSANINLLKIL